MAAAHHHRARPVKRLWLKRMFATAALLLLPAMVGFIWLVGTESGLRWVYQQAGAYLPEELTIDKIEGRLIEAITVTGLSYQHDGTLIETGQIIMEWQPVALFAANIDISRLHVQSLKISLPPSVETDQAITLPSIQLPWRLALKNTVIDGISISQAGENLELKQIRLDASALFSRINIESFSLVADAFELNISGRLNPVRNYQHKLDIDWRAELPGSIVLTGKGRMQGDIEKLKLQQQVNGALQMSLNADVRDLTRALSWQAEAELSDFRSTRLDASWPEISGKLRLQAQGDLTTATVSGTADGKYADQAPFDAHFTLQRLADNSVQIEQLMLHSVPGEIQLNARGTWTPGNDGGHLALDLDWQNLRWPLNNEAWFDTATGTGRIEGNIQQYRFDLTTDRPWPQAPASTWYVSGEGNIDGLETFKLRITALDGEATASGQMSWSPALSWQAEAKLSGINPGASWPEWPGQIKAKLSSKGRTENGQLVAEADISQMTGELRGYAVSLYSRLRWHNEGLDVSRFDFQSGSSRISANGRIGSTLALNWNINATSLAELYPRAEGRLLAEGQLHGPAATPVIDADFNGEALSLPGYQIGNITGAVGVDLLNWQKVDIKLTAENIKLDDYAVQSLQIDADTKHLVAKAIAGTETALIELSGESELNGWRGQILRADLQSTEFANWQLTEPTAFNVDKDTILLETLCWHGGDGKLCVDLQREHERWQSRLEMSQLPLRALNPWLPPDLKFEGTADATAELQLLSADQLFGMAHIDLLPGAVSYPLMEGERERWQYRSGKVDLSLNQQGVEASAEIAMGNGDRFKAKLALPDAKLLALDSRTQPVQASAQLDIHDLGLVEALVPEVQDFEGAIDLALTATGTLDQPRLSGQAHLRDGTLRIPRLGLKVEQINITGQSNGFEKLSFHLDARSGKGRLDIDGDTLLDRAAGWPSSITIKGEAVEVSQIPEARLVVSPDLQVKLQQRNIEITGEVHIPYAKLQPKDITTAVSVSEDAVIIGDQQLPEEKWSIVSKVRLTLGERVNFYGFGFEGRLAGSLEIIDKPGLPTSAIGEISVPEGRYSAYGQRLDIEHGRLLYTSGPIINPGLDLRAVRRVGDVTAGLKVRGSLNKPQVQLFSIPAMGQTDALAYLLLGAPIENASGEEGAMMARAALALSLTGGDHLARTLGDRFGLDEMHIEGSDTGDQASLVIGRYLSPRLYVSYGVGLIETVNTLNVRYKISDKWVLKGESGEHQGADFLYTYER